MVLGARQHAQQVERLCFAFSIMITTNVGLVNNLVVWMDQTRFTIIPHLRAMLNLSIVLPLQQRRARLLSWNS
jgi:hypothetical protein